MYKKSFILWSIGVLLFTTVNTVSITRESKETGELELTVQQYRQVLDGEIDSLTVVSTANNRFDAGKVVLGGIIRIPIIKCSDLFAKFLRANLARLQGLANRNCRVYFIIWRCPYGGYRFFVVKPFILCGWREPIYKPKIPVWEWPQLEVELTIAGIKQ